MIDDQHVSMADGNLVLVKKKSSPGKTVLRIMWVPVVMDPVSYAVLLGKEDVVILGSPTLTALGSNVYDSLGECVRERNLSVRGVESPNLIECRRVSIAVEALLQRGPGIPKASNEAVKRLVSRGSDMGIESEQEEHERTVSLAKVVETAAVNDFSVGGGRGYARS